MELLHLMVAHSYRIDYMFRSCQISEIKPTGGYKTRFAVFDDEGQQSSEEEKIKKEGKEEEED